MKGAPGSGYAQGGRALANRHRLSDTLTTMAHGTASALEQDAPRAGRPRNPETEKQIVRAAAQILCDEGYDGLTMEKVAARANVSKMTVYRRWKSRADLIAAVLDEANLAWPMPNPQSSSLADDLSILYRNWVNGMKGAGRVIPALIAEAVQNPDLATLLHERFILPRRLLAVAIVEQAIRRGEIPAGADAQTAIDMFMGRMWYRQLVTGASIRVADEQKVVTLLLNGLRNSG
jgi:AcrR family transcriptional regulator